MTFARDRKSFKSLVDRTLAYLKADYGLRKWEVDAANEFYSIYDDDGDIRVSVSLSYPGLPMVTLKKRGAVLLYHYSFSRKRTTDGLRKRYYQHIEGRKKVSKPAFAQLEARLLNILADDIRSALDHLCGKRSPLRRRSWVASPDRSKVSRRDQ